MCLDLIELKSVFKIILVKTALAQIFVKTAPACYSKLNGVEIYENICAKRFLQVSMFKKRTLVMQACLLFFKYVVFKQFYYIYHFLKDRIRQPG